MIDHLEKNKVFAIIFTLIIAIEIFVISSIPGREFASGIIDLSLLYHFMVFFLLNFFVAISLNGEKKMNIKYLFLSIVFSIVYAILDEIHQIFVPRRLFSLTDILVDTAGIFLSLLVYVYYKNKKQIYKPIKPKGKIRQKLTKI